MLTHLLTAPGPTRGQCHDEPVYQKFISISEVIFTSPVTHTRLIRSPVSSSLCV